MREGLRRWLIRGSWVGCLACAGLFTGLRLGRPLYYTDGTRQHFAADHPAAGLLRWQTPQPELELPGPVQGRIAQLPDGRLLYGQTQPDGTTDLVLFDPKHRGNAPEPAYGLNTAANELAPAVGPDGRVYFASDRDGGNGGYDLYVTTWQNGAFSPPVPVAFANTAFDETDPAPSPDGRELVFTRVDRAQAEGRNGTLFGVQLGGELEPQPLFPFIGRRRAELQPEDRDPAFASDGGALWFLRRLPGQPAHVYRAARLGNQFDVPGTQDDGWGSGELRAPLPVAPGFRLLLLKPGKPDLLYVSTGREWYPWWPGQALLELWLIGLGAVFALLLLLLHLGRRWRQIDILTQCILLSLLLHLLVLLWLTRVEVEESLLPGETDGGDGGGGVSVQLVAAGGGTGGGIEVTGPAGEDLAAMATFRGDSRDLSAADAAPAAQAEPGERADAATLGPDGAFQSDAAPGSAVAAAAALQDAAAVPALRAGSDAPAATAVAHLPAVAQAAAAAATAAAGGAPASGSPGKLLVAVPGTGVAVAERSTMLAGAAGSIAAALPAPAPGEQEVAPSTGLRDDGGALAAAPARAGSDATAALQAAAQSLVGDADAGSGSAAAAPTRSGQVAGPAAGQAAAVATPGSAIEPGAHGTDLAPVAAGATALPGAATHPGSSTPRAVVQDEALAGAGAGARRAGSDETAPLHAATLGPTDAATASGRAAVAPRRAGQTGGTASANGGAAPVTGSVIESGGHGDLAAVAAAASALPSAAAPHGSSSPRVAMHDGPVAAAVGSSGRAGTDAGAPGLQPLASGAPADGPLGESPKAARTRGGGATIDGGGGTAAPAAPGGALERAAAATALAAATPGLRAPVPGSSARRGSANVQLRDGDAVVPAAAVAAHTGAGAALRAAVLALPGPGGAAPVPAPARPGGGITGEGAGALALHAPASLLERAPGTTPPLPTPRAPLAAESPYSNRFGPAKAKAIEQFGGTVETERAVAQGLRYLASIQNDDGSWGDRSQFDNKYGEISVGKTALCLLAFLGAGHSPVSHTEHSAVVHKAVQHLLQLQDEDTGAFGSSSAYGHGISTYALAECYGLTKDPQLRHPVEEALTWILQHQGPRRDKKNQGGWGYFSPGLQPEDDYARVSVSAWMVMALESARLSGIDVPDEALPKARRFFEQAFDAQNGWFRYNHKPSRVNSEWPTLPASTPAGAFCLLLLGEHADTDRIRAAVDYTVTRRPEAYRHYDLDDFVLRAQGNVYFWYYASLCCFLAGGDAWARWNERLRTVLPAAQERDGSFPPIDEYAKTAGDNRANRAYTTAMCVLSLEVYYRYFTPLLVGR